MARDFINKNHTQLTYCADWRTGIAPKMAFFCLSFFLQLFWLHCSWIMIACREWGREIRAKCEHFSKSRVARGLARLLRSNSEVARSRISSGIISHTHTPWNSGSRSHALQAKFMKPPNIQVEGYYKSICYLPTPFKWFLGWKLHHGIKWPDFWLQGGTNELRKEECRNMVFPKKTFFHTDNPLFLVVKEKVWNKVFKGRFYSYKSQDQRWKARHKPKSVALSVVCAALFLVWLMWNRQRSLMTAGTDAAFQQHDHAEARPSSSGFKCSTTQKEQDFIFHSNCSIKVFLIPRQILLFLFASL